MAEEASPRVVAVNRGVEASDDQAPRRGPEHDALEAWVGRWINEGHTIDDDGTTYRPSMQVTLVKVD